MAIFIVIILIAIVYAIYLDNKLEIELEQIKAQEDELNKEIKDLTKYINEGK